MNNNKTPNDLIHEDSLYLQQHAYNPVRWKPWSDETLALAKRENKLLVISIGYSSCHWCHVMEHQCFEDLDVAKVMNENFINIKVDREDRPDIDAFYMSAIHLMGSHGGWPLNIIALPDTRPIYGGTYFPKVQWINVLSQLNDLFQTKAQTCEKYANELTNGIIKLELLQSQRKGEKWTIEKMTEAMNRWKSNCDEEWGGQNGAPKFPMPGFLMFQLKYGILNNDQKIIKHVLRTLKKMACGGIYDQLAGGFARYSTDSYWKVPHFEKMLYDNAQLISLYCTAFRYTGEIFYQEIAEECLHFNINEMSNGKGLFYSSMDADSEGIEGKYYVWTKEELNELCHPHQNILFDYYGINSNAYWENGHYVLLRDLGESELSLKYNKTKEEIAEIISKNKSKLLSHRKKRIAPVTDKKLLCSWNALMVEAICQAALSFNHNEWKTKALQSMDALIDNFYEGNVLVHVKEKNTKVTHAFLEDYAFTIQALLTSFSLSNDNKYLNCAQEMMHYCRNHYFDKKGGHYYFNHESESQLLSRKVEWSDNVIPSSSAQMANNLFHLGRLMAKPEWCEEAIQMSEKCAEEFYRYPGSVYHWGNLALKSVYPCFEVVFVGKNVNEIISDYHKHFHPNAIFAYKQAESTLPLLSDKPVQEECKIYVCRDFSCMAPVNTVEEAINLLH